MASDPIQGQPVPPPAGPAPAPPAPVAGEPGEIQSTADERQMAMLAHVGGIIPFLGFAVPLGLWAAKMGQSPFIEDQAKESLNLQINVLMLNIVCAVSCMIYIGFVLTPALWIINGVYCYMAGMKAKEGVVFRYPYTIRYIT
ncbi:hypothetical protein AYO44_09650 [Planctomycetaceae bacterium SCGC AG-212-F19]|nr:hypothetical protein AYO44_09650 [Planctomycetaceae bacterium SCGC AG-212-F19]